MESFAKHVKYKKRFYVTCMDEFMTWIHDDNIVYRLVSQAVGICPYMFKIERP